MSAYLGNLFGTGINPETVQQSHARIAAMGIGTGSFLGITIICSPPCPPLVLAMAGASFFGGTGLMDYVINTNESNYNASQAKKKFVVGVVSGSTNGVVPFQSVVGNVATQAAARRVVEDVLPKIYDGKPITREQVIKTTKEALLDGTIAAASAYTFQTVSAELLKDLESQRGRYTSQYGITIQEDKVLAKAVGGTASGVAHYIMQQIKNDKDFTIPDFMISAAFGGCLGALCAKIENLLEADITLNKKEIADLNSKIADLKEQCNTVKSTLDNIQPKVTPVTVPFRETINDLDGVLRFAASNGSYVIKGSSMSGTTVTYDNIEEIKNCVIGNSAWMTLSNSGCTHKGPQIIVLDGSEFGSVYREIKQLVAQMNDTARSIPGDLQNRIVTVAAVFFGEDQRLE